MNYKNCLNSCLVITALLVVNLPAINVCSGQEQTEKRLPGRIKKEPRDDIIYTGEVRRWAILIGIGKFGEGISNLGYASSNAEEIGSALLRRPESGYSKDRIIVLTTKQEPVPTVERILSAFENIRSQVKSTDALFVFISSHGFELKGQPYLIPPFVSAENVKKNKLALSTILKAMSDIPAGEKVLVIDACHSGLREWVPSDAGVWGASSHQLLEKSSHNMFILSGSSSNGVSYESTRLRSGVLSYYLVRAINEPGTDFDFDEVLSAQEAFNYVSHGAAEWSQSTGFVQVPCYYSIGRKMPTIINYKSKMPNRKLIEQVGTLEYAYNVQGNDKTGYHIVMNVRTMGIGNLDANIKIGIAFGDGRAEYRFKKIRCHLFANAVAFDTPSRPVRIEVMDYLYDPTTGRELAKVRVKKAGS